MFTPISVSLSGPAFSFLLYENAKCRFQQEGFLLGEVVFKETKTITDNDQQQINTSRTIKINSVMPCPQNHYFYNGIGKIDEERLREFLGNQFSKVVAWYKFQRQANAKMTFRDKVIHRQLSELFSTPELFSFCILSNEVSENASTHMFSQVFIRCNSLGCEHLPIHVPNLSEPNNMYKSSEPSSETFNKLLRDLKIDRKNTQGLVVISKIQNALQKHVETLVKDISDSAKYLHELEEEVKHLQIYKKVKKKNDDVVNTFVDSVQSSSQETNSDLSLNNRRSSLKKRIDEVQDVPAENNQSCSQITNNDVGVNKKRSNTIDTPPSGTSSPEAQRKVGNKRQAVRGKGRRKDSRELKKNSKTDDAFSVDIKN